MQISDKGANHKLVARNVPKVEHNSGDVMHLHLFPIVHFFDKEMGNKVAKMVSKGVEGVIEEARDLLLERNLQNDLDKVFRME